MEDAARTLFVTDPNQKTSRFKGQLPKIIFIVLSIVVAIELVLAGKQLLSPVDKTPLNLTAAINASGVTLALEAPLDSYWVGEVVPVSIYVATNGREADGVDVVFKYDQTKLEASSSAITTSPAFTDYPIKEVDQQKGLIRISGISSAKPVKGSEKLAIVNFKAKAKGPAKFTIDSKKGFTDDSNVSETGTGKDILDRTLSLDLTIN